MADKIRHSEGNPEGERKIINGIEVWETIDPDDSITKREFLDPKSNRNITLYLQNAGISAQKNLVSPIGVDISLKDNNTQNDLRRVLKEMDTFFSRKGKIRSPKETLEQQASDEFASIQALVGADDEGIYKVIFPDKEKGMVLNNRITPSVFRIKGESHPTGQRLALTDTFVAWLKANEIWPVANSEEARNIETVYQNPPLPHKIRSN